ncbi:MAG: DEAD/DEAH box helicase family protein [Lachnospiraceae bacterium]|nr:DEAD/DEAH box helicase family protein [Lachnospiraceae bacterium]
MGKTELEIWHESTLSQLHEIPEKLKIYSGKIIEASDRMMADEVMEILKTIPVDEINRESEGLRIKDLKDEGINTIADVLTASMERLIDVKGISEEGAKEVKRVAMEFASKAKKDVKLRLSIDDKTPGATQLVTSVYRYRMSTILEDRVKKLLDENEKNINLYLETLNPSGGIFGRLFSDSDRTDSRNAISKLTELRYGDYGKTAKTLDELSKRLEFADEDMAWEDFKTKSTEYITTLEHVAPDFLDDGEEVYGLPEELAKEVQAECFFPDGLRCTLRRYQEWGVKYILHQERVLLGDEMGLGKTVQAIAAMVSLKNTGATHFVVVCPASVITNWCREIKKFSGLAVFKVHGDRREKELNTWKANGGAAVTTYETTGTIEFTEDYRYSMLVVDEAHYIKNPSAARSANVKKIAAHAERILFMTGTALENRVDEMISLIEVLKPDIAEEIKKTAFLAGAPQFREKIAPVYYRRKREQVLGELPEMTDTVEWCNLNEKEEAVYEKTLYSKNFMSVRRVSWNVDDINDSSKAARLKEIVEEAKDDDRKIIVFSFFLETVKAVCDMLGDACMEPITGSLSPEKRQAIIDEFDKAPAGSVLPAQIQSGGTGLNIQSASVVVLCEPQYKPSIENQAISRAYRMGQVRNVLVYRLLADDTVDERILEILEKKQAEFDAFADESVAAKESLELDEKTFGNIIEEEIERIKKKQSQNSNAEK